MITQLAQHGAHVDAIYYCPHHPDDNCDCRKPKPRMVFQAARDLDIDLSQSYVVGDSEMDVERVGEQGDGGDLVAASLKDAAYWLVQ